MAGAALTYALVTPARDEEANLQRLAASLVAQTVLPSHWIVVDDGSVDGTRALIEELSRAHDWISVVAAPPAEGALGEGRLSGRDVAAFEAGLTCLRTPPDVVLKLDADVAVLPDFFERLLAEFDADPALGIAGGACFELEDGAWTERLVTHGQVRGATRAYRWDCLRDVAPLEARLGWDGIDLARARLAGWSVRSIRTLPFFHYRAVGERDGARRAAFDQGTTMHFMGYRPSYVVARTLFSMRQNRAAYAMVDGYVSAWARRQPQIAAPGVRDYIRTGQRFRELPKRVAEVLGRGR